jgi:glucose-specific phosphotransferase system IIA component
MRRLEIRAPMTGRVVPMESVPDPVFAERMLGDGLAIDPTEGVAVAPIAGRLTVFHSAGHAFAIETTDPPIGVLVHVGLDTVGLGGRGFERLAEVGDDVSVGAPIVRFDLAAIAAAGLSAVSPVVLPQLDAAASVTPTSATMVRAGSDVLLIVDLPDGGRA